MRAFSAHKVPIPSLTPTWADIDHSLPVDIEIGAGAGLHALEYARRHPGRNLIAIERTTKLHRLKESLPPNLHFFRADAVNWITHHVPENSVENIFILYPNPFYKNKQRNLRWYNMPFMGFLKTRLRPGGKIVFATNLEWYENDACDAMVEKWSFQLVDRQALAPTFLGRTHFERKYLVRGDRCWNLIFQSR